VNERVPSIGSRIHVKPLETRAACDFRRIPGVSAARRAPRFRGGDTMEGRSRPRRGRRLERLSIHGIAAALLLAGASTARATPVPGPAQTGQGVVGAWSAIEVLNAPTPRCSHAAVFTGFGGTDQMIVWGGQDSFAVPLANSGGAWRRATDTWRPLSHAGAPAPRQLHPMIWTGRQAIVWGGDDGEHFLGSGGRYDPVADAWSPTSLAGAPTARVGHTLVWAGDRMIVWGGATSHINVTNTGALYDPFPDAWSPTSTVGAPSPRTAHASAWTGNRLLVWGGSGGDLLADGGVFDPRENRWRRMSDAGAPEPRMLASSAWDGRRFFVWGGLGQNGEPVGTGGIYTPALDQWQPIAPSGAPSPRMGHTAVATPKGFLVWGGDDGSLATFADGGLYDPDTGMWRPLADLGGVAAPTGRQNHTAVWDGARMIVWGGFGPGGVFLGDGFAYEP
jgi:hypothetical protein